MALRSRLRRAFQRSNSQDDDNSNRVPKPHGFHRPRKTKTDPLVYQPGEKMPPLKYRRPVAPEHKAHLESFEWSKAWRRRSEQSIYSPMGSRMPSRKSSYRSLSRRSFHRRSMSRSRAGDDGSLYDSGIGASLSDDRPERLREGSDEEGDVTNVGLSRNPTEDPKRPKNRAEHTESVKSPTRPLTSERTRRPSSSKRERETLFSPEDLELALQKSNLTSAREEAPVDKDDKEDEGDDEEEDEDEDHDLGSCERGRDSGTGILNVTLTEESFEREPRPRERLVSFESIEQRRQLPSMLDV